MAVKKASTTAKTEAAAVEQPAPEVVDETPVSGGAVATSTPHQVVAAAIEAAFIAADNYKSTSGRELALVKTKLEEAAHWFQRVN